MTIRKLILGSAVALATMGAMAIPAQARTDLDVYVNYGAPPPAYYERVPAVRVGYTWVPGYWEWRGHRHVWVAGRYVRTRPGHVHYAPHWRRDADGDGVPNRYDRSPHNPYRY